MMAMLGEGYGEFGGGEFRIGSEVGGSDIVVDLAENVNSDSCVRAVQSVMLFSIQSINGLYG